MLGAASADGRQLRRLGGVAAIAIGIAYIVTIALYAGVGAPPTGGEAWLKYLAGRTAGWWAILALSVLTDLLFIPVAFALYFLLKGVNRTAMLVATALVALFVVLDLAVTWANYASLITLSGEYSATTGSVRRASLIAAADYASAVLSSRLEVVYAIVLLSSAILVIAVVMLKGKFGRPPAYIGVATGILGVASLAGWTATIILNALCATIWTLLVGYQLLRFDQQQGSEPHNRPVSQAPGRFAGPSA